MSKWEKVRLGDVCQFINGDRGKNYPSSKDFVKEGIPFVNAGHLVDNTIDFTNMNYISEESYKKLGSGKLKEKDIVYCLRGSLGKHAIVSINIGAVASSLVILRPNTEKVLCNYLSYCIDTETFYKQQFMANNGSSQPNLSATSVKQFEIPLPPLEIQNRIAQTLDTVSELLTLRKKQLAGLDNLIKATFYKMFGYYKKSSQWHELLPNICKFIDYRGKTPEKTDKGIPLITAKNIKNNSFSREPLEYISIQTYNAFMTRGFPKVNDVIFTTEAPLGNVCRIPNIIGKFAVGQRIIVMQPYKNMVTSEYLEFALACDDFQKDMIRRSSGSTVRGIRSNELVQLSIPVPPISLQNQFANIVTKIEEQKALVQKAIDETQLLFDSLMSEYFE